MTFVITPYVLISAAAAIVAALVAVAAWQRRSAPSGSPLVGLMVALIFWSGGAALEYATIGIPGKLIWSKVMYVGVTTVPVFFLLLVLEFDQRERWLTRRTVGLLFVVPLFTLLMALTNEWHGQIWSSVTLVGAPADNIARYVHGMYFWFGAVGYSYVLLLIGTVLLIGAAVRQRSIYRYQAAMLLAAALAPWLVNALYIFGYTPLPGLEPTPFVMVGTGAICAWTILRYRLLDLAPVARARLIETMADGMLVLDVQGRVVDINPAAQQLLAAQDPIEIGRPAAAIFAAWPEWNAELGQAGPVRMEMPWDGSSERCFELSITPVPDRRRQQTGRLVVIHDITARKAAQIAIEQLNNELEERVAVRTRDLLATQERFRQVITSISDHVFALQVGPDGALSTLYSSPRIWELTGHQPAELEGGDLPAQVKSITYPEDRSAMDALLQTAVETGAAETEVRLVRGDGTLLWVRTSARLQARGAERILYCVVSDITQRKEMEQMEIETRTLAELDRLRSELVSNVSHELRTPLGLIKAGSTTLLRRDVSFPPAVQQTILQGITDEADRLEHLVSNLLDIARLDQNRFFLNCEPTDMQLLITDLVNAMERKLASEADARHTFVLSLPPEPVVLSIDARKMEQVLRNLFENAIRYSPEGGVTLVTLQTDDHQCEIKVIDQGIGIAPEDQSHIFERFYRSHDIQVQRIRGAGLGLSICREILRAHEGSISVTSARGHGATFVVRLPRSAECMNESWAEKAGRYEHTEYDHSEHDHSER